MNAAVSKLPTQIADSLSALTRPSDATVDAHAAAVTKLNAYEKALGIAPESQATIGARVSAVIEAAEQAVNAVLPAPLTEEQRSLLSSGDITQQAHNLKTAIEKVGQLQAIIGDEVLATAPLPASKTAPTPTGTYVELPDNREGFAPHRAYHFLVAASKGTVLDELKMLLGEEAAKQLVI